MRCSRAIPAFILAMAICAVPVSGAEISVISEPPNGIAVIRVQGALDLDDGDRFAAIASQHDKALIVLASDGGKLVAGLRIGQLIRLHGFATIVPDGTRCASACAIAWLGGVVRFMQPTARIGFHAAYRMEDGVATETGAGNALVGAYLSRLGLSDSAIVYIEQSHPDQITWLTKQDAEEVGIDVAVLPPITAHPPKEPGEALPSAPSLAPPPAQLPPHHVVIAQSATQFVTDYFLHWSDSNSVALSYFASVYAPRVEFYGRTITRELLLNQKRQFAERWPQRVYAVRPSTIRAHCDDTTASCVLSGIVDWDARNADLATRSAGAANFTLKVKVNRGTVSVESESGSVISREVGGQ
jgi:hypothetical protein